MARNALAGHHCKGAANELIAATWYLQQGHQVYWPTCQQGKVDFIADVHNRLMRVQVKTARWRTYKPELSCLQCHLWGAVYDKDSKPTELYDVLFVIAGEEMWKIPANIITNASGITLRSTHPDHKSTEWDQFQLTKPSEPCSTDAGETG